MAKEKRDKPTPREKEASSLNIDVVSVPGFKVQNESRSNYFDGEVQKFPKVKSFWEAEKDDEVY
jgi:hypothetical protein